MWRLRCRQRGDFEFAEPDVAGVILESNGGGVALFEVVGDEEFFVDPVFDFEAAFGEPCGVEFIDAEFGFVGGGDGVVEGAALLERAFLRVGIVVVVDELELWTTGANVKTFEVFGLPFVPAFELIFDAAVASFGHAPIEGEFEIVVELDGLDVLEGGEAGDGFEAAVFDAPGGVWEGAAIGGDPVFKLDGGEGSEEDRAAREEHRSYDNGVRMESGAGPE